MTILGMALMDQMAAEKLCALPDDLFVSPDTAGVHRCLKRVLEKRWKPDAVTVIQAADELKLPDVTPSLIMQISSAAVTAVNYGQYETILLDLRRRRHLLKSCAELANKISDPGENVDALVGKVLTTIRESAPQNGATDIKEALMELMEHLEKKNNGGVETGIAGLDRIIGGFREGQLIFLGARPGVGKTAMAINIAIHVARFSGPVLFVSEEMSSLQITARLVARETGGNGKDLDNGTSNDEDWGTIWGQAALRPELPIRIAGPETIKTPMQLRREVNAMIRDTGLKLIVVDYLQLLHSDEKKTSRYEEISDISREIKIISMETGVPILALTQFNRSSEMGGRKRKPTMAEAKDSGSIEQDANIFLTLYAPDEPRAGTPEHDFWMCCQEPGLEWQVLDIEKNRQGPTGAISLQFDKPHMTYTTLVLED